MTQEHGAQGHVHDFHANYFKSVQHGHAHISRFRDYKGPRVLETQLSFEEELSQYDNHQDSDTMLTDSEETCCSELDTADSQNKVSIDPSHSRPVLKFQLNGRLAGDLQITRQKVQDKSLFH